MICPSDPHHRNPNAPKFEDRSQEETEWQEQGAREARWKLAKNVLKFKEHERATLFSLSENRCLPASTLKPEEREFVVDSGASMHMISKKDLSNAEMNTLTKSCSPTIFMTANGEVQTHEEAIVYVKELDILLTMKVLDNTPAVLSLGKLCDENGYSYEWIYGQKPHLIKDGIRIICNTENFVPIVVPGLSTSSTSSLPTSPPMTSFRREIDHSKSSSSLSTSTPMTSSTEIDHSDHPPAIVSSESVDRQERVGPVWDGSPPRNRVKRKCGKARTVRPILFWNIRRVVEYTNQNTKTKKKWESRANTGWPVLFRYTGMVARIQRESCGWQSSWRQRLTTEFFSWIIFRTYEKCGFG